MVCTSARAGCLRCTDAIAFIMVRKLSVGRAQGDDNRVIGPQHYAIVMNRSGARAGLRVRPDSDATTDLRKITKM